MKKNKKYYNFFIGIISVAFLIISSVNIYGDDTKKSDEEKKQASPSVSVDKDKNTNKNIETERSEQKTIVKNETTNMKRKVPAFWFLLPEK